VVKDLLKEFLFLSGFILGVPFLRPVFLFFYFKDKEKKKGEGEKREPQTRKTQKDPLAN